MARQDSYWVRQGFSREWWKAASSTTRKAFLETLNDDEIDDFYHDWDFWARDKQLMPEGEWHTILLLCGRGFGKSRTGAQWIEGQAKKRPFSRWCLLGPSEDDVRRVMIEGESGLLAIAHPQFKPKYYPSVAGGELHWPNGSVGYVFSSEDPESLRGPQFHGGWVDEPMAMNPKKREAALSNMDYGMRLGSNPQVIYTTTPKPHRWLTEMMAQIDVETAAALREHRQPHMILIRGSTFENDDLPERALAKWRKQEGTNLGRQELYAEILGDEQGALWTPFGLDQQRLPKDAFNEYPDPVEFAATCDRVIVSVDPNLTSETAHAAGIIVCGARGVNRYVIADRTLTNCTPSKWARAAVQAYVDFDADEIVAEINQGGDLVRNQVQQLADEMDVPIVYRGVRSRKGKARRAEPVATMYDRRLVWHIGACGSKENPGPFYNLEVQLCGIHGEKDDTGEDFDRADALVHGMVRLGVKKKSSTTSGAAASGGFATFEDFSPDGRHPLI